jgi:hypothetical protein
MGKSPLFFQIFGSKTGLVKERTGPIAFVRNKEWKVLG